MALTLAIPLSTQNAFSHGNVDQQSGFDPSFAYQIFSDAGGSRGQVFVPTSDNLIAIDQGLIMEQFPDAPIEIGDTFNIVIHPGNDPNSLLLPGESRTGTVTSIDGVTIHFDLDSPVTLVPGQPHILELETAPGQVILGQAANPSYPDGDSVFCFPGCGGGGFDLAFRTYFEILNSPPDITAPDDVTSECNEPGGATGVDLGTPTVEDPDDNDLPPTNDAEEPFDLGDTTVTWSVEDTEGASDSDTQTVTVVDTTPPEITVPDGFMAIANTDGGWSGDIGQATATDVCSDVEITNNAPAVFPLGDTTVTWCATDDTFNQDCATQTINVKPLPVEIDIKPQSCPNPVNTNSRGLLPVAILGNDLDVSQIDVSTIQLEGVSPINHDIEDVATPFLVPTELNENSCTALGPDGSDDLTLKFDAQTFVAELGSVSRGDVIPVELTGLLLDGTPFEGYDIIIIK